MVLLTFCATPIASSTWRPSKAYLPAANTGIADGVRPVLGGRWVAVAVLLFVLTALVRRMGQYLLAAAGAGLPRHLLRDARARRGRHWAGAAALLPRGLPCRLRLVAGCAVPWPRRASAAATTEATASGSGGFDCSSAEYACLESWTSSVGAAIAPSLMPFHSRARSTSEGS